MLFPQLSLSHSQLCLLNDYDECHRRYVGGYGVVETFSLLSRRVPKKKGNANSNNKTHKEKYRFAYNANRRIKRRLDELNIHKAPTTVSIIEYGEEIFSKCKKIHYSPTTKSSQLYVDGSSVPHKCNPTTMRTQKGQPHVQLDENIMSHVGSPTIEPSTANEDDNNKRKDVFKITFPEADQDGNEVVVHVIYAKKGSPCPILSELHDISLNGNHKKINKLMDELPNSAWEDDHVGGGEYLPVGFGMEAHQGGRKGRPFTLKTLQSKEGLAINEVLAQLMHATARTILEYFPLVYHHNQHNRINTNVACPQLRKQNLLCNWFCTQIVIRRIGLGVSGSERWQNKIRGIQQLLKENNVSFHFDGGDFSCKQPLLYLPCGGPDGVGGVVRNSHLVICNHQTGGKSIRIKTNIPDTVVIVIFNSRMQLHGVVEGNEDGNIDRTAFTTRIIPFISEKVHNWMKKNPSEVPLDTFNNFLKK